MPTIKAELKELTIKPGKGLPTEITEAITSITDACVLLYAVPGWGKTEFFMSNPKCLLLACESGHKFTSGYKVIIDCWDGLLLNGTREAYQDKKGVWHDSFVHAVANLQKPQDLYNFVFIDTVDSLIKMLLDYKLGKAGVQHASDGGEYGKGWDILQNTPFRKEFNKLLKAGLGVGASTHEQAESKTFKKSGTFAKKETTLPGGIYKIIYAQFDVILHGVFGKMNKETKKRWRILQSEGSEDILAKNRGGIVPPAWIVPQEFKERWKQFAEFFNKPETKEKAFKAYETAGYELD